MTPKQYKNVIDYTLTQLPAEADSLITVREILRNCGTPLPQGTPDQILNILLSDDYIGWDECDYKGAVAYSNAGVAAIGIGKDSIMLIEPQTDMPAASEAIYVSVPACKRNNMHFYTYNAKTAANRTWSYFAKKVIHAAEKYIGMSYEQIGATNPNIKFHENAWCVDFVRQCCYAAGVYRENINIPSTSSTKRMHDWFIRRYPCRVHKGISGVMAGDIVFIKKNGKFIHTCLAAAKEDENNDLLTINGNWVNERIEPKIKKICYSTFPLNGQYVDSYVHPHYF